jgi:hypothetical protein
VRFTTSNPRVCPRVSQIVSLLPSQASVPYAIVLFRPAPTTFPQRPSFRGSAYNIVLGPPFHWVPASHGRSLVPQSDLRCPDSLNCLFVRDILTLSATTLLLLEPTSSFLDRTPAWPSLPRGRFHRFLTGPQFFSKNLKLLVIALPSFLGWFPSWPVFIIGRLSSSLDLRPS